MSSALAALQADQFRLGNLVRTATAASGHPDTAKLARPDPTPNRLRVDAHRLSHFVDGKHLFSHALKCSASSIHA